MYASALIATEANATRVRFSSSRILRSSGSAHTPSDSTRGGNASNATNPMAGSSARASSAPQNISVSTAACPVTSSGLFCEAKSGRIRRSRAFVDGASSGSGSPCPPAASANSVHAPPDCRAAATPSVRSLRWYVNSTPASNIVTGSSTRTAPCPRSQASRSVVSPASAPVCATIARRTASERPAGAHTMTGLRAACSASSPRPMPSTSRSVSM